MTTHRDHTDTTTTDGPEPAATLTTPGFVDAHIHPDKTTWGSTWLSREPVSSLSDLIAADLAAQLSADEDVETRAFRILDQAVRNGTMAMRAHVDVSSELGLRNVHGVRAAAERLKDVLDVQIVAFPQFGMLTNPGTLDLMEQALGEGADHVGGIDPVGLEGDLDGHLGAIFSLADKHGRDLDIHLHDQGPDALAQIREIARRTLAAGMRGRVTIAHGFAVCDTEEPDLPATLDAMAEAGVWLATCALGDSPVPTLDLMERHGVRVALGSDGIRDSWSPFGTGSMVDRAHLLGYRTGARTDAELERCLRLATTSGAELVGAEAVLGYEGAGSPDRVEFSVPDVARLVVERPAPLRVVRGGRTI
ncbi:amidohydrolase family protein [Nocardiopsis alba]|uniref:amidohydrolase family protein n=1 Tax=Nocardiopsis alba TaxID=53437 RepID=UPI0035DAEC34